MGLLKLEKKENEKNQEFSLLKDTNNFLNPSWRGFPLSFLDLIASSRSLNPSIITVALGLRVFTNLF